MIPFVIGYVASRGNFNFGNADQVVNWATMNGKLLRGRPLGASAAYVENGDHVSASTDRVRFLTHTLL